MTTIDVHTHVVPRGWPALPGSDLTLRIDGPRYATIMQGSKEFRRITDTAWNVDVRLADMDAAGVDAQVLSPTPVFFSYESSPKDAAGVASIMNDLALDIAAQAPDRLVPFCQVPLQDADAACAELDRCREAGHLGVEIGNHVGDRDLDDEGIVTFLQHCAATGMPVFVHPWDMPSSPRLNRWMARWLTGMPAETHLSILAMILGGTFDRVDDSLRICFAHGGGSFAFWLGRVENAWHHKPDLIATSEQPPSAYLGRFYVDSVVFDKRALRLLIDTIGVEKVLLGSDYPYPLGEAVSGTLIRTADNLTDTERRRLLGDNATTFLGRSEPATKGTA